MYRFENPYWLLLLVLLAIEVLWLHLRKRPEAVIFSDVRLLKGVPQTFAQGLKWLLPYLSYVGLGLAIIALARPQSGLESFKVTTEGVAIMLCIDRSGSMQALDFQLDTGPIDRLTAVKKTSRDFVAGDGTLAGRSDDLIGLIAFGGYVDSFCPLTLDHGTLLDMLDQIRTPERIVDRSGNILNAELFFEENQTAIGDALIESVRRLRDCEAKSKIIILLSDGENTTGIATPEQGAKAAKLNDIKVYTIGIGTTGLAPYIAIDQFGERVPLTSFVNLDEGTLGMIANETGGKYYNAQSTQALDRVYEDIDQLERTVFEGRSFTRYRDFYPYFLGPSLVLLLLSVLLANTRFRSIPY